MLCCVCCADINPVSTPTTARSATQAAPPSAAAASQPAAAHALMPHAAVPLTQPGNSVVHASIPQTTHTSVCAPIGTSLSRHNRHTSWLLPIQAATAAAAPLVCCTYAHTQQMRCQQDQKGRQADSSQVQSHTPMLLLLLLYTRHPKVWVLPCHAHRKTCRDRQALRPKP